MSAKDLVVHFYTRAVRGCISQGRNITQTIRTRSEIEDLNICREIHTSVLSTLLQSTLLKGEERVRTISEHSFESFGLPFDGIVYTEKWGTGFVRGFADKLETDSLSDKNSLMIGRTLYGATSEYQTVNKLESQQDGLTEIDILKYFENSEQIPTKVAIKSEDWADYGKKFNGIGLFIQTLPGIEEAYLKDLFSHIVNKELLKQISENEFNEEGFQLLFKDLEDEVKFEVNEYEFKCNCSKESMMAFVEKLEINELLQMKNRNHPVSCSHCNETYEISAADIDLLIK
jgi:redox-regulated HSP33 family molecular chaperone